MNKILTFIVLLVCTANAYAQSYIGSGTKEDPDRGSMDMWTLSHRGAGVVLGRDLHLYDDMAGQDVLDIQLNPVNVYDTNQKERIRYRESQRTVGDAILNPYPVYKGYTEINDQEALQNEVFIVDGSGRDNGHNCTELHGLFSGDNPGSGSGTAESPYTGVWDVNNMHLKRGDVLALDCCLKSQDGPQFSFADTMLGMEICTYWDALKIGDCLWQCDSHPRFALYHDYVHLNSDYNKHVFIVDDVTNDDDFLTIHGHFSGTYHLSSWLYTEERHWQVGVDGSHAGERYNEDTHKYNSMGYCSSCNWKKFAYSIIKSNVDDNGSFRELSNSNTSLWIVPDDVASASVIIETDIPRQIKGFKWMPEYRKEELQSSSGTYTLYYPTNYPSYISIEGSNDQTSWQPLWGKEYQLNKFESSCVMIDQDVEIDGAWKYYRFTFTRHGNDPLHICQLSLTGVFVLEGNGDAATPYIIKNAQDLKRFAYEVTSTDLHDSACARLEADIVMDPAVLFPSISNPHYNGTFDGNCHTISNMSSSAGLFDLAGAATIKNLGLCDTHISKPADNYGGLVTIANDTQIENCYVTGSLDEPDDPNSSRVFGGLVGKALGNTRISNSYTAWNVQRTDANIHLSICGEASADQIDNCYYYGNGLETEGTGTAVTLADLSSGDLAYRLNRCIEDGTAPYFQLLGTDPSPVLQEKTGNHVYLAADNQTYTNVCPHRDRELVKDFKAPTCLNPGNVAYYLCHNPGCQAYHLSNGGIIDSKNLDKETKLSINPYALREYSEARLEFNIRWNYSDQITKWETIYYNVMELHVGRIIYDSKGDYGVVYTNLDETQSKTLHVFYTAQYDVKQTLSFYVNNVECTDLRHTLITDGVERHLVATFPNLHPYDIIKVVFNTPQFNGVGASTHICVATDQPTEWTGHHNIQPVASTYNCVEGGYDAHHACTICRNVFSTDSHNNSDMDIVPLSTYWRAPTGEHHFELTDDTTIDGLQQYACQNPGCIARDTDHFVIPQCMGNTDVFLNYDGTTFTSNQPLDLHYGQHYWSPVEFQVNDLNYTRDFVSGIWSTWYAPFDVTSSELMDYGLTPAYVEGMYNYDEDNDGEIDSVVMQVVKIVNGCLRAGIPYLVRAEDTFCGPLSLAERALKPSSEQTILNSSTTTTNFDFIGTYQGLTMDEVDEAGNLFSLSDAGTMNFATNAIQPLNWYCKITFKDFAYENMSNLPYTRQIIHVKVVGEMDEPTGIITLYPNSRQPLEHASGIFTLQGIPATASPDNHGVIIRQGKKVLMGK